MQQNLTKMRSVLTSTFDFGTFLAKKGQKFKNLMAGIVALFVGTELQLVCDGQQAAFWNIATFEFQF